MKGLINFSISIYYYILVKRKSSKILFCTVTNDNFIKGTLVMIYSMAKHIPNFKQNYVRVFYDDSISPLSENNKTALLELMENIELVHVKDDIYREAKCKNEEHRLAYLTIETFKQNDFSSVVFFDGDMITMGDFTNVLDFSFPVFGSRTGKFKNISGPRVNWRTINTGFFGINMNLISRNSYNDLKSIIKNRLDTNTDLLDQKVINNYFSSERSPQLLIHHFYNFRDYGANGNGSKKFFLKNKNSIKVLHYSGYEIRPKPWETKKVIDSNLDEHPAYIEWFKAASKLVKDYPKLKKVFK